MTDLKELISNNPRVDPEKFDEAQRLQRKMGELSRGASRSEYDLVTPYQRSRKRTKDSVKARVHLS